MLKTRPTLVFSALLEELRDLAMHIERRGVIFERGAAQAALARDAELADHRLGRLDPPRCACRAILHVHQA